MSRSIDSESKAQLGSLFDIVEQEVSRLTSRLPRHAYERDELVSCAFVGLCEARVRFRTEYGVPLGAYARLRIRGSLLDGLRNTLGVVKRRQFEKVRRAAELSEGRFGLEYRLRALKRAAAEQYNETRAVGTPERALLDEESKMRVRHAVDTLTPGHRHLVRSLFGLDGEAVSGEVMAKRMGRNRSSVCRQKHRALELLRAELTDSPPAAEPVSEPCPPNQRMRAGRVRTNKPVKRLRLSKRIKV